AGRIKHVEPCGGIAKESGKVCKRDRLVRHDMTLGTKRASAVGIGKAVSAVACGKCHCRINRHVGSGIAQVDAAGRLGSGVAEVLARRTGSWRQDWARQALAATSVDRPLV
ncbi:hypothetical protein HAX54_024008, partial [Datura stramonium]|nr:hypothetical protein [Datura stramonium]